MPVGSTPYIDNPRTQNYLTTVVKRSMKFSLSADNIPTNIPHFLRCQLTHSSGGSHPHVFRNGFPEPRWQEKVHPRLCTEGPDRLPDMVCISWITFHLRKYKADEQQQVSDCYLLALASIQSKNRAESDGRNATRRNLYADDVATLWLYAMDTRLIPTTNQRPKTPTRNSNLSVYFWLNHGDCNAPMFAPTSKKVGYFVNSETTPRALSAHSARSNSGTTMLSR